MHWTLGVAIIIAACGGSTSSRPADPAPPAAPVDAAAPREVAATPPVVVDPSSPGLQLGVAARRVRGGRIQAGSVLETDEDFAIEITLDHAAYVYVGGLSSAGQSYLRFPKPDQSALLAAGPHRIPEKPSATLFVGPPAGQETLFVVASREPVADVDRALAVTIGEVPRATPPPAPPPAPVAASPRRNVAPTVAARVEPPRATAAWKPDFTGGVGLTPRGVLRPREIGERDDAPDVVSDAGGTIVYVLRFSHRPRP